MANPKPFHDGGRDASESPDKSWRRRLEELREGGASRVEADEDWRRELNRNTRQDREALGQPKGADGTPWLKSNRES